MKKDPNIEEQKVCKRKKKLWAIGWMPCEDKNWMPAKLSAREATGLAWDKARSESLRRWREQQLLPSGLISELL